MLQYFRIFVLSLAVAAAAGCASPDAVGIQDRGQIAGRVLNSRTQQPIANALVSVGSTTTVYSGPQGDFNILTSIGPQTVRVSAAGYSSASQDVVVSKSTPVQLQIPLDPLAP